MRTFICQHDYALSLVALLFISIVGCSPSIDNDVMSSFNDGGLIKEDGKGRVVYFRDQRHIVRVATAVADAEESDHILSGWYRAGRLFQSPEVTRLPLSRCSVERVILLDLANMEFDDAIRRDLAKMTSVKYLRLPQSVSGRDIEVLSKLRELQVVAMCNANVDWTLLRNLNAETLRKLYLTSSSIDDDSVKEICQFSRLQYLSLCGTKLTDSGMRVLGQCHLADLGELSLEGVPVTDKGVRELAKLPKLERLNLFGTTCDDSTIEVLADMPALRYVALGRSRITDAGVSELRRRKKAIDIDSGD